MKVIDFEVLAEVCELLEIDPDDSIEIDISINVVTVTKTHAADEMRGKR